MEILKPGAAGYEEGRRVFNGMIDRRPALIALCETEDDVRAALDRAARDGLPVSVRGGGHNVAGHGIGEGSLVIHLGRMRHTEVDAGLGIAHAQGGATWGDFDAATQAHGLATPGGIVSTTGLAGLTLGGGIGVLRGKHGLTCDNLVGARLVTAGGGRCRSRVGLGAAGRRRQLRHRHHLRPRRPSTGRGGLGPDRVRI